MLQSPTNHRIRPSLASTAAMITFTLLLGFGPAPAAEATGLLLYAVDDGQVRGLDMATGADSGLSIPASAFFGTTPSPATSRNIAYDPATDLLWYAASDNNVRSLSVSSLAAGPTISDINDAFYGSLRTLCIDRTARRLYISASDGDVEVYSLVTNSRLYTIPVAVFGMSEPNPGNLRRLAADGSGLLWYAAADGAIKEFDPSQYNPRYTGRELPVSEQIESSPGQFRYLVAVTWPAGQRYLYYAASDSTVRAADLATLRNVSITYFSSWFQGSTNPGQLRSLSVDPSWTPSGDPPAIPTNVEATNRAFTDRVRITWDAVSGADTYALYRSDAGGYGNWSLWNSGITDTWTDDLWADPDVTYGYFVIACNLWGCSNPSDAVWGSAGTLAVPYGLLASQGTWTDRVRVSWGQVSGAGGYLLSRQALPNGLPTSVWVTGTMYDDFQAAPGVVYHYWVTACHDQSNCGASTDPVFGWIQALFADGFEYGHLGNWSAVVN